MTLHQVQGAKRTPSRVNTKKVIPRHITFKLLETEDNTKIFKVARSRGAEQWETLPELVRNHVNQEKVE